MHSNKEGSSNINIQAVSSGLDSITFYVDNSDGKEVESTLHTAVIDIPTLSSVTAESPIAIIRISGGVVTDQTSVLRDLLLALSENNIHLNDLITSATSIGVFVNFDAIFTNPNSFNMMFS